MRDLLVWACQSTFSRAVVAQADDHTESVLLHTFDLEATRRYRHAFPARGLALRARLHGTPQPLSLRLLRG